MTVKTVQIGSSSALKLKVAYWARTTRRKLDTSRQNNDMVKSRLELQTLVLTESAIHIINGGMLWWKRTNVWQGCKSRTTFLRYFARESKYFPRSQSMGDWDRNTIGNVENKAKRGADDEWLDNLRTLYRTAQSVICLPFGSSRWWFSQPRKLLFSDSARAD